MIGENMNECHQLFLNGQFAGNGEQKDGQSFDQLIKKVESGLKETEEVNTVKSESRLIEEAESEDTNSEQACQSVK